MRLALVALAACWTGPVETAAPVREPVTPSRPLRDLEIVLRRGHCFGMCPVFMLTLHRDGRVEWNGEANVAAVGRREGHVHRGDLEAIDRQIDAAKFFQRDPYGHIPKEPACTRSGNTSTCSFSSSIFCTDTSHTTLTIKRGAHRNVTDNAHCSDEDHELVELEDLIVTRAGVAEWIGR